MADNVEEEESTYRGSEWEVVSLSASAYDACPGSREVEVEGTGEDAAKGDNNRETSPAVLMSGHFSFPPRKHEKFPSTADKGETVTDEAENIATVPSESEGNSECKELNVSEQDFGVQSSEEMVRKPESSCTELEEETTSEIAPDENSNGKQRSELQNVLDLGGSTACGEELGTHEVTELLDTDLDSPIDSPSLDSDEDSKYGIPLESRWKRGVVSLYAHVKEANTFWSIFIAAAMMGLVILGQRWQEEKWSFFQWKWRAGINQERNSRVLRPLSWLKEVIVGGHCPSSPPSRGNEN